MVNYLYYLQQLLDSGITYPSLIFLPKLRFIMFPLITFALNFQCFYYKLFLYLIRSVIDMQLLISKIIIVLDINFIINFLTILIYVTLHL
jgi:hypothetical protein